MEEIKPLNAMNMLEYDKVLFYEGALYFTVNLTLRI